MAGGRCHATKYIVGNLISGSFVRRRSRNATEARDDRGGHLLRGVLRGRSIVENIHVLLSRVEPPRSNSIGGFATFVVFDLKFAFQR